MKYFIKNKKIKIIAIIIFLVVIVYVTDFGFLKSEITSYQMKYRIVNNSKSCLRANPTTYKILTKKQEVLSWMSIGSDKTEIERYTNCAIRNRKNWNCKFNDGSGSFGFSNGVYEQYPRYGDSFNVSRLRWLVGYVI